MIVSKIHQSDGNNLLDLPLVGLKLSNILSD
jgi:hypothetical protein